MLYASSMNILVSLHWSCEKDHVFYMMTPFSVVLSQHMIYLSFLLG